MIDLFVILFCFLLSFVISTFFVRRGIPAIKKHQEGERTSTPGSEVTGLDRPKSFIPESGAKAGVFDFASTGLWIGLFETILIFVFVFEREYGALAIIIAAKEFVRKEKVQQDPTYYLLGTLGNLAVATLFALLARTLSG
jgi:hypothetical protein